MPDVLDLVTAGNEDLDLTRECGAGDCIENRLVSACAYYCEATGTLAALMDGDLSTDLYGDMYPSFVDLSAHCDAAVAQAGAGAWANVPFYLDLMREAAMGIETWAREFDRPPADTAAGGVPCRRGAAWEQCAAALAKEHRGACRPDCDVLRDYAALLNEVASRCGGSDVHPRGGARLVELWQESTVADP